MSLSKKRCRELYGEQVKEYRHSHSECAICGIPEHLTQSLRWPSGLQLAHIMAGVNRKDHPANVLMLCSRDHGFQHAAGGRFGGETLPKIDLGVLLAAKRDLGEYDPEALSMLTGYQAGWFDDQVSEVPEHYTNERQSWRFN